MWNSGRDLRGEKGPGIEKASPWAKKVRKSQ